MSCWAAVKIAIMGEGKKTGGMQGKSVPLGEGMERQKQKLKDTKTWILSEAYSSCLQHTQKFTTDVKYFFHTQKCTTDVNRLLPKNTFS